MALQSPRSGRTIAAVLAALLSVYAVAVELLSHICAESFFDPLPDALSLVAYGFLPLTLLFNEWVLGGAGRLPGTGTRDGKGRFRRRAEPRWPVWAGLVGTGAALAVAGAYTVIFLPLLPLSILGFMLGFFGVCAWSPLFNLVVLGLQLRPLLRRRKELGSEPPAVAAASVLLPGLLAAGLVVLRPVAIGMAVEEAFRAEASRAAAVARLRALRAEPVVLSLCYRASTPAWITLGRRLAGGEPAWDDTSGARRLYYLLTGRPFETADASRVVGRGRWDSWSRDPVVGQNMEEQGGELVGTAVRGLSLEDSRLDGVIDPRTETVYSEWTLVFRNANPEPAEARAEILLPEGGVVDKVSLWINGEERPAAFGPRSLVQQAYQEVAVAQRRDPLLVTAKDAERVLAQCFPVPAQATMKVRLGMTAPLIWKGARAPRLVFTPPAFREVNFKLPAGTKHAAWLEGHWPPALGRLGGEGWTLLQDLAPQGKPAVERTHTARVSLPAPALLDPPVLLLLDGPPPLPGDRLSPELIRRESPFRHPEGPVDLLVVVDTAADMVGALAKDGRVSLAAALAELPAGSRVRFADARALAAGMKDAGTAWMEAGRAAGADSWWNARRYEGGTEPRFALAAAWEEAAARPRPAAVLWLHGAVPSEFGGAEGLLQNFERRPDGPALVGVQLRPGPDSLMRELSGRPRVAALAARDGVDAPAEGVLLAARLARAPQPGAETPLGGGYPARNGVYVTGDPTGKPRTAPARLAAASRALAPWRRGRRTGEEIARAQKAAIVARLVTPLCGAVVLETREQYDRFNLSDAAEPGSIPSVPEPGTLALLALAGGAALAARLRPRKGSEMGR